MIQKVKEWKRSTSQQFEVVGTSLRTHQIARVRRIKDEKVFTLGDNDICFFLDNLIHVDCQYIDNGMMHGKIIPINDLI